jgi:hypothetical protein
MDDIRVLVDDIIKNKHSKKWCQQNHPTFFEKYPILSKCIFENDFDHKMLSYMFDERLKIQMGDMKEHDVSVNVGSRLVDKYIKHVL